MWILVAVIIEAAALAGVLGVLATGRTRVAFLAGFNVMAPVTGTFIWQAGFTTRAVLIAAMVGVYLLHMNWVLLAWSRQTAITKIDRRLTIRERVILPVVLTNTVGWAYCLPLYLAVSRTTPPGARDALALSVYVIGTALHFGADYQKWRFKTSSGGGLLDTGLWRLCRHPNYFGDFLVYVSFAVTSGSAWGWIAPLLNLLQYLFDAIPKNEKWAAEHYGSAWAEYTNRTSRFVPYVF
jgi:steroid 5-alpha reductase family enzyme